MVVECLAPRNERETGECLGLKFERKVEVLVSHVSRRQALVAAAVPEQWRIHQMGRHLQWLVSSLHIGSQ